jgi:hypothetical protein
MLSRRALLLPFLLIPAAAPAQDVSGAWSGWGRLTNDWPGLACVYDGSGTPGSVKLDLKQSGTSFGGTILLDVAPAPGSGCPPLRKQYLVVEARPSEGALTLVDSGGLEWNLAVREAGSVLAGLVAWKEGGAPEALAAGFSAQGKTPLVRLSGEVRLERPGAAKAAPATASTAAPAPSAPPSPVPSPSPPAQATEAKEAPAKPAGAGSPTGEGGAAGAGGAAPQHVTGGDRAGHILAIIGANVVAAGAIYGVNKLGQSSSSTSTSCSPRNCFIGAPGEACLCNANVLAGAPCETVPGGVPLGGACDGTTRPCQSGFSCNGGICQDGSGACPY